MFAVVTLATYLHACAPTVSTDTMRAIIAVESRGYSYAVRDNTLHLTYCVPGGHAFPCGRETAIKIAATAVGRGHSVDVGIAQVNSGNFRTYGVTAAQMLRPCDNLRVGSAILTAAYRSASERFNDQRDALWHAIMAYNTGSLYEGEPYVRSVVDGTRSSTSIPSVPSIAILRSTSSSASSRNRATWPATRIVTRMSPASTPAADPRAAPLDATRASGRRGDLSGTLIPALLHS
ncbi:MAG: lytic transglycosylase domain-containing protein [Vulcanimicrobiaceae bacterium]